MKIKIEFDTEETLSDEKTIALVKLLFGEKANLCFVGVDLAKEESPPEDDIPECPSDFDAISAAKKKAAAEKRKATAAKKKADAEKKKTETTEEKIGFEGIRALALIVARDHGGAPAILKIVKKISGEDVIDRNDDTHWAAIAEGLQKVIDDGA